MTAIEQADLVALTSDLVSERSENPPGNEKGVARVLERRLRQSPVEFEIAVDDVLPDRPNVVARAGDPSKGSMLLTGHTDVVPADATQWEHDPFSVVERGDRMIGRGVADMKGALAAKLLAAEAYLSSAAAPGEVILAFVIDEEHGGAGTRALVERGIDADAAIIGEPSSLQICTAQKGVARYIITVTGRNAHVGTPDEGADAIRGAGRILDRLAAFDTEVREESDHPSLAPETATVTEIAGGIAPNIVADTATLTVDWRLHPDTLDPATCDRRIDELLGTVTLPDGVTVDVERDVFARGAELAEDHPFVDTVHRAARDAGLDTSVTGLNAVTDARFLIHDANIPTVVFGAGSLSDDAHAVDESIGITDLLGAAKTYRRTLEIALE